MKTKVKIRDSWAVQDITYEDDGQRLIVHMQNTTQGGNKRLLYSGVSRGVFDAFVKAESKGKFFNSHIRNNYTYHGEI